MNLPRRASRATGFGAFPWLSDFACGLVGADTCR